MRDPLKPREYFDGAIAFERGQVQEWKEWLASGKAPSPDRAVLGAYASFSSSVHVLILRYSRGDDLAELPKSLEDVVVSWESLLAYLDALPPKDAAYRNQYESLDFDHYPRALWLLAFAVLLKTDALLLARVIRLIDNSGKDALLDKIIHKLDSTHEAGATLLYPRPYQPLNDATDAAPDMRPALMARFIKNWYQGCRQAYWYNNGRNDDSGYFGYWCFEAALVARLWHVDDATFHEHPHYPTDLAHWQG